jgi:4-aminobutyrate aminotransferase-like enzyme
VLKYIICPTDVLNILELRTERDTFFESFPQAPGSEMEMRRNLFKEDSWELDIKTTTARSHDLDNDKTTAMRHSVTGQLALVTSATKNTLFLNSGMEVLDASCGAAVACLGYDLPQTIWAAIQDSIKVFYVAHRSYSTPIAEEFKRNLLSTTEGHMVEAYIYNSGE